MRRWAMVAGLGLAAAGCGGWRDMVRAHPDAAAAVGSRRLAADRLAGLFADSPVLTVQADVMARVAHLWVNYVLFADRVLAGDSLLDSASVLAANWPALHQILIGRFHEQLTARHLELDSARLDSIYQAGEYRLIRHILLRADTSLSPAQLEAKRRQAERIRAQLAAGGSWEEANRANEDVNAKAQNGVVGVIARGETVAPFDAAAFALGPGEMAPVTRSAFGFHVLQRPRLAEVRAAYRRGIEQRLMATFDSTYLADLPKRLHLKVRSGAPAAVREVARDPLAARTSREVLATFDGGRFTAGELARWFDLLPPRTAEQVSSASDEDLKAFIAALARNAMLLAETRAAGVHLTAEEYDRLKADLASQLAELRRAMELDALSPRDTAAGSSRQELAGRKVDAYLGRIAQDPRTLVPVPTALADHLRERGGWRIYPAGVQRAFELAQVRRQQLDSAAGRVPPSVPGGGPPR